MIKTSVFNASPWRFKPGDDVHVRGWPQGSTVKILCQAAAGVFPHYYVMDLDGYEWRIAQIELSRKAIPLER